MPDQKHSVLAKLTEDLVQLTNELTNLRNKFQAVMATKPEHVFDSHEEAKVYFVNYFTKLATLSCVQQEDDECSYGAQEYRERYLVGEDVYLAECQFTYNYLVSIKNYSPEMEYFYYRPCGDFAFDEYGDYL